MTTTPTPCKAAREIAKRLVDGMTPKKAIGDQIVYDLHPTLVEGRLKQAAEVAHRVGRFDERRKVLEFARETIISLAEMEHSANIEAARRIAEDAVDRIDTHLSLIGGEE